MPRRLDTSMGTLRERLARWPSRELSAAIIGVAVLLVLAALTIHNPWLKAGILAYEVLP